MFPLRDNILNGRFPIITVGLIIINAVVYFILQKGGIFHGPPEATMVQYGAVPYEFTHPGAQCELVGESILCDGQGGISGLTSGDPATWVTAFSSMFMHGGIMHLIGNMVFLWVFGSTIENVAGRTRFVLFYIFAGLAALATQIVVDPNLAAPMIGASGAVAGIMGGYILLYPRARVLTLVFIVVFITMIEIPAMLMLGFWFLQQIAFGYFNLSNPSGAGGGVAYFAHIGGFVFGLVMIKSFASNRWRHRKAQEPEPYAFG